MTVPSMLFAHTLGMSLLMLLLLVLRIFCMGRIRAAHFYVTGMILILGLLIPVRPMVSIRKPATIGTLTADVPQEAITGHYTAASEKKTVSAEAASPVDTPHDQPQSSPPARPAPMNWALLLAALWGIGAVFSAGLHVASHMRFRRMVTRWQTPCPAEDMAVFRAEAQALGVRRLPTLVRCGLVQSPLLLGLWHPVIVLPAVPLVKEDMRLVLRHELTHHKRHDLWYKALIFATACVHWFNPLVHRLARVLSVDCEMSCDDAVLDHADLSQRKRYGRIMLAAVDRQNTMYAALSTHFCERGLEMKRRFAAIVTPQPRHTGAFLIVLALLLTLAAGTVLALEDGLTLSPTTGLETDKPYRPILVNIDNSEGARPAWGLAHADIVYEAIIWGPGHTRYLALFNDTYPETVGPIRGSHPWHPRVPVGTA